MRTGIPQARPGSAGSPLFGREAEVALLDQLVARITERGGALVLRGDPGIGKTALLTVVSAAASSNGVSVLRTAGAQSETRLAFAGLHQLLRPVLTWLDRLPVPQRDALSAAFGALDVPAPDPFLIALAALNLLASEAERVPLLLVVDDTQWLDPPTTSALAFIARRVEAEPIAVLFAARNGVVNELDGAGLPELVLGGLDEQAASALVDASSEHLTPNVRRRVLEIAAGNPLALLELPDSLRLDDARIDGFTPAALSLTSRLERAFAQQASGLAQRTPSPTLHSGLVYARAMLAADDEAEQKYDMALRSDLRHHPFDHARLQLAYGAWLRRHRRVSESRPPLRAARQVFDALGCFPWEERTRQELRASGGSRSRSCGTGVRYRGPGLATTRAAT